MLLSAKSRALILELAQQLASELSGVDASRADLLLPELENELHECAIGLAADFAQRPQNDVVVDDEDGATHNFCDAAF